MKYKEYLKLLEREGFDDIDQPFEKDEPKKEGEQYYYGEKDEDEVYNRTKGEDNFHYDDDEDDDDDEEDFSPEELDELRKRVYSDLDDKEETGIRDINKVLKSYSGKIEDDIEEEEEEDEVEMTEEEEEAYDNLAYTIRKMISGSKITNFHVYREGYDFSMQFVLSKKERLGNILHIMGVMKKLASDILIQYDAEIDLWETKKGEPLLSIDFWYSSKKTTNKKDDEGNYLQGDGDYGIPF